MGRFKRQGHISLVHSLNKWKLWEGMTIIEAKFEEHIDLIHKWRSIYHSFVEVQISLPSLDTIK